MRLADQTLSILPRPVRRYLRHVYTTATGQLHRNHHEMAERDDFFRRAMRMLEFNGISGDYAEFGSHGGMTLKLAHRYMKLRGVKRHLWAFDSFQGLPEWAGEEDEHPAWVPGDMSTSLPAFITEARANGIAADEMTTVAGFYEDTLDKGSYTGPLPDDLALCYIDCDLHSSTASVLRFLAPRMKHGMVIAFDDYFCHGAKTLAGERAAMLEFLRDDTRFEFLPYHQIGWHGMSFILEDRELLDRHRKA